MCKKAFIRRNHRVIEIDPQVLRWRKAKRKKQRIQRIRRELIALAIDFYGDKAGEWLKSGNCRGQTPISQLNNAHFKNLVKHFKHLKGRRSA